MQRLRLTATSLARRTRPNGCRRRVGFTLIELLIAVSILVILVTVTATAIKINLDADKVRGSARQIQSYLMGARDRAVYAKEPRGVRFLLDTVNPNTVKSMVYIEALDPWKGQVEILLENTGAPRNANPPVTMADPPLNLMRRVRLRDTSTVPNWSQLVDRGLLTPGLRIKLPGDNRGNWYVIESVNLGATVQDVLLTEEYKNPSPSGQNFVQGLIELPAAPLPNAEPVELTKGAVIDLNRCGIRFTNPSPPPATLFISKLPAAWLQGGQFTNRMDLLFSPRGNITGPAAAAGIIHLYVTDQEAADLGLDAGFKANPAAAVGATVAEAAVPDKFVVSIFTRTGQVLVAPIRAEDGNADGLADDPFFFAERGEVAGR